jgi:hypothetical protein
VETEHEHRGASHVHTGAVAPVERHTVTRWHWHKGYKRAPKDSASVGKKEAEKDK